MVVVKLVLWFLPHFCVRCSFLILEVEESACNVTFGCALPRVRVALVLYPIALDSTCITFQYKTFLGQQLWSSILINSSLEHWYQVRRTFFAVYFAGLPYYV